MKIDIAGLKIDGLTKQQLLDHITDRLKKNQKTFVTTPYSEFLFHGLRDPEVMDMLNKADFAVPDGIGIFWAHKFLSIPLTATSYYRKILQALWQMVVTGLLLMVNLRSFYTSDLPEKIPGSELIWDLAKIAAEQNKSIFLLGGFGSTPEIVAQKLTTYNLQTYNLQLNIAGYSPKAPTDLSVINDIKNSGADMVFVAYGPFKQEQWILDNKDKVPATLFIGLGGTFDYIAGAKQAPPKFVRTIGLEWLWRLITQPTRIKRIWNATVGLITALMRYKVFMSMPYRPNVVCVIVDKSKKLLACKRNPVDQKGRPSGRFANYWQFPQGGINTNEDLVAAAKREVREETGIKSLQFFKRSTYVNRYIWKNNSSISLLSGYRRHKGQEQQIVYLNFIGDESEIQVDNHEFIDYQWVSINAVDKVLDSERKSLALIAQEDLKDLA